jgi:hypothetical protein
MRTPNQINSGGNNIAAQFTYKHEQCGMIELFFQTKSQISRVANIQIDENGADNHI